MRQRLSFDSGRVSTISTRSPTWHAFASSCALSFLRHPDDALVPRMPDDALDPDHPIVFCIASLVTTPYRARSPRAYASRRRPRRRLLFATGLTSWPRPPPCARLRGRRFAGAAAWRAVASRLRPSRDRCPAVSPDASRGFLATPMARRKRRLKISSDELRCAFWAARRPSGRATCVFMPASGVRVRSMNLVAMASLCGREPERLARDVRGRRLPSRTASGRA